MYKCLINVGFLSFKVTDFYSGFVKRKWFLPDLRYSFIMKKTERKSIFIAILCSIAHIWQCFLEFTANSQLFLVQWAADPQQSLTCTKSKSANLRIYTGKQCSAHIIHEIKRRYTVKSSSSFVVNSGGALKPSH